MAISIYQLKPGFQALLRPAVRAMFGVGVTANQVTVLACLISVGIGIALYLQPQPGLLWLLIPVWMLLRMAFNAIDGMLAREFGQKSALGAFLNELTDVIADAALYLPFALLPPFAPLWVGVVIVVAGLTEFAGALGATVGAARRYDGPMGKSDRAFVFGVLGLWAALAPLPNWLAWVMPALAVLLAWTVANRVSRALTQAHATK